MLNVIKTKRFRQNYIECTSKYDSDIGELDKVIHILASNHKLHPMYKEHSLDKYKEFKNKGLRDCHIVTVDDDWILIYLINKKDLLLIYTGSHKNFFKYKN